MQVSYLPLIMPLMFVGVPLLFLVKGRMTFVVAMGVSTCLLLLLILSVYVPGWVLMAKSEDPAAQYELARWKETHCEQLGEVILWPCEPDLLGGYALLEKAAGRNYLPALWLVGVRLKYGIHVPEPPGWTGPGGNHFPQPERGQKLIDRAIALGFRLPPDEENYYGLVYRTADKTLARFLAVVVWLGVVGTCSLVGARLGSMISRSIRVDPRSALHLLAILVILVGYSTAARFLLSGSAQANYWPPALQALAAFVLISLGLEAVISTAFKSHRAVLRGSLVGLATTLCAIGCAIPCVPWLEPIFPDVISVATFMPTFAGALASYRIAGEGLK